MEDVLKNLDGDFCVIPAECLKKMTESVSSVKCPMRTVQRKSVNMDRMFYDISIGLAIFFLIVGLFLFVCSSCEVISCQEDDPRYSLKKKCPFKVGSSNNIINLNEFVEKIVDSKMKKICESHRKCPEMMKVHNKEEEEEEEEIEEEEK